MDNNRIKETREFEDVYLTSFNEALEKLGETELLETIQNMPPRLREATVIKQLSKLRSKVYQLRKSIAECNNAIKTDHSAEAEEVKIELKKISADTEEAYKILTNPGLESWAQMKSQNTGLFGKIKKAFSKKESEPEPEMKQNPEAKDTGHSDESKEEQD